MTMQGSSYSFPEEFQKKLAAYIIQDPRVLIDYRDVVNPTYFEPDYLTSIIRVAKDFVLRYNQLPTKESLSQDLMTYCTKLGLDQNNKSEILGRLEELYSQNVADSKFLKDKIISFGKRQAFRAGIMECAQLLQSGKDYSVGAEIMRRALLVGENVNDFGSDFFGNLHKLPTILSQDSTYAVAKRVPTLWPTLNTRCNGGPGRKQVWVVMGLPGGGKSSVLVNIGWGAIVRGLPVVHYTLGDLHEHDVQLRYAARATGLEQDAILANDPEFYRRIQQYQNFQGRLLIKYYPSMVASVDTLRAHLSNVKAVSNMNPALVIVDYADELAEMRADDSYKTGGQVYSSLNHLANDYDVLCWTGSQVNRYSPRSEDENLIKKENIADSWQKTMKADGIISVNQTDSEYQKNGGRIWIDKVRRGKSFHKFYLILDHSRCMVKEAPPPTRRATVPPVFSMPIPPPPVPLPPMINPLTLAMAGK